MKKVKIISKIQNELNSIHKDQEINIEEKVDNDPVIEKYKAGAEFTENKVKILRPVNQGGVTFQRNYWVSMKDVKPTDKIVEGGAKGVSGSNGDSGASNPQSMYLGTDNRELKEDTTAASVRENAKNFVNAIFQKMAIEPFDESIPTSSADQIKKLALVEQKLRDPKIDDIIKEQLVQLKQEIKNGISSFFNNANKINDVIPYIKEAILKLHNQDPNKNSNNHSPIDNYLPLWLRTSIDVRHNSKLTKPEYNFNTNKLEVPDNVSITQEHYNNSVGHKIEDSNKEILSVNKKFIQDRNLEFGLRGQNLIDFDKDSNINNGLPMRVDNLSKVYPNVGYGEEKGWSLDYIDPNIGKYYDNLEHTNLLSNGLQLFMKDSAFRVLYILDKPYAELLIGILLSNTASEGEV